MFDLVLFGDQHRKTLKQRPGLLLSNPPNELIAVTRPELVQVPDEGVIQPLSCNVDVAEVVARPCLELDGCAWQGG